MANTNASGGKGLVLAINTSSGSTPTWTIVGESMEWTPGDKNDTEEATNFQSGAREFITVMLDMGEQKFTANRYSSDAGQAAVSAIGPLGGATAGKLGQFKVTAPLEPGQASVGDIWTGYAIVASFTPAYKADKKTVMSGQLRTSNLWTFTPGS